MSIAALTLLAASLTSEARPLKSGVNITRWFCYQQSYSAEHCKNYLNAQDFANFKKLKIDFVRLCVAPEFIDDHGALNEPSLALLDEGIAKLNAAGLTVLLDLHDNGQLALDKDSTDTSQFISFWHRLSKHYRGKHEREIIFEPLNEPQFPNKEAAWWKLQDEAIDAIRAADPDRTVVATGTDWGGIDSLVRHQPVSAKNVIYSVHCYDPFFFSHQGATWAGEDVKHLKNMPFPASPEAVNKMVDQIEPSYQDKVKWYGSQGYDAAYLATRVATAMNWGKKHNVTVFMGEFGSFPPVAPPESRARWFDGIKQAFDQYKMPNCIWGYDDSFGLGREVKDGKVILDQLTLKHFYGQ